MRHQLADRDGARFDQIGSEDHRNDKRGSLYKA